MFLIYFGILLLSAATLLFEITLTRVFSVAEWYHFAFMVISLALLGFGASGSFPSLFPCLIMKKLGHLLAICAALFSLSCFGSYLLINSIPFDSYRMVWESRQLLYLVAYYLSLAIPFFFTGLALGAALSKMSSQAGCQDLVIVILKCSVLLQELGNHILGKGQRCSKRRRYGIQDVEGITIAEHNKIHDECLSWPVNKLRANPHMVGLSNVVQT